MSESYLSRLENGICAPMNSALLDKLANALYLSKIEKATLVAAAHKSQKIIQLPSNLSVRGYWVCHGFFSTVAQFGDEDLIEIQRIYAKYIHEEDICPLVE